jgi:DnaK suppressor protein
LNIALKHRAWSASERYFGQVLEKEKIMNVTVTKSTKKNNAASKGANRTDSGLASSRTDPANAAQSDARFIATAGKREQSPTAEFPSTDTSRRGSRASEITASPAAKTGRTSKSAMPGKAGKIALNTLAVATAATRRQAASHKAAQTAVKARPKTVAQATPLEPQPGVRMRSNKASPGITDKIEQIVVSKASNVATKTTKTTPAVPADGTLLTEEQILKMDEKDYMNAAQRAFFKMRLQQLEKDLLKNADETTEHLRETVLVPDPADRATIEEEHALELRTRDRERKLLKKVQQSIASIDSGDYGWCEETGEPIGVPRLLARPTATLSLEAQQRRELKQKLYGD